MVRCGTGYDVHRLAPRRQLPEHALLDQSMLGQDSSRIGLGDLAIGYADQAIAVAHESGLGRRDELGMLDGDVWQRFRLSLKCEAGARRQ